jgi:hypothetical protein
VAPGTYILSTKSSLAKGEESRGWGPYNDNDSYFYNGGTSMATPLAAGAVALIRQYLRKERLSPSASLVKAALIHTALRKPYRYTAVTGSTLCDFEQGWGHLNLKPFISEPDGLKMQFIDGQGLSTGELKEYLFEVSDISLPFKATLVYTDYPGGSIINNLNLIVSTPNGKDYHGNQFSPPFDSDFDSGNNVETVYIPEPIAGQYKVTILANNVSEGPQDYSLAVSGGFGEPPTGKGTIRGAVVYKSTNEPVEGAQVSTDTGQGISVESNGTYELDTVPIGNRTITARKDGYQAASTRVIVEEDKVATATTIGLEEEEESVVKAVNITGKVVYKSTNKPVEGAQVSADTGQSTVTDANGAYKLSGISIGDHAVTAFKAGYRCVCKLVTVKDSKIATIDFTLRSRKL